MLTFVISLIALGLLGVLLGYFTSRKGDQNAPQYNLVAGGNMTITINNGGNGQPHAATPAATPAAAHATPAAAPAPTTPATPTPAPAHADPHAGGHDDHGHDDHGHHGNPWRTAFWVVVVIGLIVFFTWFGYSMSGKVNGPHAYLDTDNHRVIIGNNTAVQAQLRKEREERDESAKNSDPWGPPRKLDGFDRLPGEQQPQPAVTPAVYQPGSVPPVVGQENIGYTQQYQEAEHGPALAGPNNPCAGYIDGDPSRRAVVTPGFQYQKPCRPPLPEQPVEQ